MKITLTTLNLCLGLKNNKTGLQPVSKPVDQILGFYGPIYKKRCKKWCKRIFPKGLKCKK